MVAAHPHIDPTGNWTDYVQKNSGTTALDQGRTHNKVNETTDITETTGPAWADPVHDAAGNMTTVPKPADLTAGLTLKYDAWNRLVEVTDGTTVVGKYEYDGLNRRILNYRDFVDYEVYEHYYYNASWQVLETRASCRWGRYQDVPPPWSRPSFRTTETAEDAEAQEQVIHSRHSARRRTVSPARFDGDRHRRRPWSSTLHCQPAKACFLDEFFGYGRRPR